MFRTSVVRSGFSFLLLFALMMPVTSVLANPARRHFAKGAQHEAAGEWDKAAEEYALAVVEKPRNAEYLLRYRRAIFNASQMFMRTGNALAAEGDLIGAYNAYRRAYEYDSVNELAKSEMNRMIRLQEEKSPGSSPQGTVKLVQTSDTAKAEDEILPQLELINVGPYPSGVDLQTLIRDLAKSLDLNVVFEPEAFRVPQRMSIDLANVSAARALDYIFIQQNLIFQKLGPRTILVASAQRRQNYQQFVYKTFFLSNASPKDIEKVVKNVFPPNPGRQQTTVLIDEPTNSVTIRDTEEYVRLIGNLIKSLDKDRAEVVMDVSIYEVSKSDLLKFGNQVGTETELTKLGGSTRAVVGANRGKELFGDIGPEKIATVFGVGWAVPSANFQAFQSKANSKLIAQTQIHAFNNEESEARIGQRVPVRTASFAPIGNPSPNANQVFGDQISYEQVGLTLKFKPIVFPNQDVQVTMSIESKDVVASSSTLTPTFSDRSIKGTARIQNNKTLLLASVAQDVESNSRAGIPLLGMLPIIGRFFTAPTRDDRQVDIVIAITPRVIRAPSIVPEDEIERFAGSLAVPISGSLEEMIIRDAAEVKKSARKSGNVARADNPTAPGYVRSNGSESGVARAGESQPTFVRSDANAPSSGTSATIRPIESTGVKTIQLPESGTSAPSDVAETTTNSEPIKSVSNLSFEVMPMVMAKGERAMIAVRIQSPEHIGSAVLGLKFDSKMLSVKKISYGEAFGNEMAGIEAMPFINQNGKTYVSMVSREGIRAGTPGVIAFIEIEALMDGVPQIFFDGEMTGFLSVDGRNVPIKF
jgi:type II secretory pathway component GspD/PulD (secretin)